MSITYSLSSGLKQDNDGVWRVGDTRVTLETLVAAFEEGASAEEIVLRYDSLALPDVYSALGDYLRNRQHFAEYLSARQLAGQLSQATVQQRQGTASIRQTLLARLG